MLFQPLIQLVYGFLAQILAGKEIETNLLLYAKPAIFCFQANSYRNRLENTLKQFTDLT